MGRLKDVKYKVTTYKNKKGEIINYVYKYELRKDSKVPIYDRTRYTGTINIGGKEITGYSKTGYSDILLKGGKLNQKNFKRFKEELRKYYKDDEKEIQRILSDINVRKLNRKDKLSLRGAITKYARPNISSLERAIINAGSTIEEQAKMLGVSEEYLRDERNYQDLPSNATYTYKGEERWGKLLKIGNIYYVFQFHYQGGGLFEKVEVNFH